MAEESQKSLLRTDGIYVQFGSRIWYTNGGEDTTDHWYNLIRILDEKNLIFLGDAFSPFYEDDEDEDDDDDEEDDEDEDDDDDEEEDDDKDRNRLAHTFFELSAPSDPLKTVHEIMKLPKEFFEQKFPWASGIDLAELKSPVEKLNCCDCHHKWNQEILGTVQYYCNDNCVFYNDGGNPLIIKDYGSPSRVEVNPVGPGTFFDSGPTRSHQFPAYFIPDDESQEDVWRTRYNDWMQKKKESCPKWEEEKEVEKHIFAVKKYIEWDHGEPMYTEDTTYYYGDCDCECHHHNEGCSGGKPDDW